MGVTVATVRVAADIDTAPYTQDITTADLGGLTPKAALFIASFGVTDGVAAAHSNFCYGAATGVSNEWCISVSDEDGQGSSDTHTVTDSDRVVRLCTPGTTTTEGEAEFTSFISDGVRINWLDAPPSGWLITVVLFAGTDLSAHANFIDLGDSVDNAVDVTDPGFEPDILITAGGNFKSVDAGGNNANISLGAVHNNGGVTQRCFGWTSPNAFGTSAIFLRYTASYGILGMNNSGGGADWSGEFGGFDANGFTITTRNAGANNSDLLYLALNFNSAVDSWVGTHTTPTSTGNGSEAGPSFTPQAVILGTSLAEAVDTAYNDNRAGSMGISVFDADNEYTTVVTSEDAVATTNTQSLSDDRAIVVPDDDGTLDIEATFVSFDANGWTVNYTNAPATAKLFWALAIEEVSAPAAAIMPQMQSANLGADLFDGALIM